MVSIAFQMSIAAILLTAILYLIILLAKTIFTAEKSNPNNPNENHKQTQSEQRYP